MLFLWSVENLRVSKVNLSEPPDNDNFDALAQKTMHELDKEETSTKGKSKVGKERPISNEHPPQKSTLPSAKRQAPSANHMDSSRAKRQLKQIAKEPPQALQKRQDTV